MGHMTRDTQSIAMFSVMVIGTILPIQLTLTLTYYLLLSSADNLCNSLDQDQARQNVGSDLESYCLAQRWYSC